MFSQFGLDAFLIANQKEGFEGGAVPFFEGEDSALNEVLGGEIAAHGIQGNLHLC